MYKVLFGLALAVSSFAQVFTHGPLVSNITSSTARVIFITDSPVPSAGVQWGTTTKYQWQKKAKRSGTVSSVVISGLTPGTTYHVQAIAGAARSHDIVFTTAPESRRTPLPPQPVDVSMPDGAYAADLEVSQNCSNLPAVLAQLASLSGSLNQRVVIDADATCTGQFKFPPRPRHTGWVVVTTSGYTATGRAKPGTPRARFVTNSSPATRRALLPNFPGPSTCKANGIGEGGFFHVSSLAGFPMMRCSDLYGPYTGATAVAAASGNTISIPGHSLAAGMLINATPSVESAGSRKRHVITAVAPGVITVDPAVSKIESNIAVQQEWRLAPHTSGPALPPGAPQWNWHWKSDTKQMYWAMEPGRWTLISGTNPASEANVAAINVPEGAERYRFVGLEVTGLPVPDPGPDGWSTAGNVLNSQGSQVLLISSAASDVIWDRCYIHGYPKPARFRRGISLRGDRVAVIDSLFEGFQEWRGSGYAQTDAAYAIVHYSGGPALIRNNHLEAAGITYYAPNTSYSGEPQPHDVTITGNLFKKRPEWRRTDAQTDVYPNRHSLELKQGERYLISGNTFDYNWSGINAAAHLCVTPRCSSMPKETSIGGVSRGLIMTGPAQGLSEGDVVLISGTGTDHDGLHEVESVENAAVVKLRGTFLSAATGGKVRVVAPGRRISDLDIQDNRFYRGTEILRIAGSDNDCGFALPSTTRVRVTGNFASDHDIRSYARGGRVDQTGQFRNGDLGARIIYILNGEMEYLEFSGNRMIDNKGNSPTLLVSTEKPGSTVYGFRFRNNVFSADTTRNAIRSEDHIGTEALGVMFPRHEADGNTLCCDGASDAYRSPVFTLVPSIQSLGIATDTGGSDPND
jgi:hypothetical protein